MENLWRTDAIGISDQASASPLTADESSALRQFFDGLRYDGKRYTVEFPKRETIDRLTSNRNVALRRLESKLRQLRRDPEKHKRYHEELMKFIKDGHAVEVETSAVGGPDVVDGTYHMPHHEVITSKEAGDKWRIVFDCSAKDTSKKSDHIIPPSSLNDHLLPGPNLNADLVTLLINFRLHAFAVSADIRGAYMRIGLAESDRDRFRFLWTFPGEEKVRTFRMVKVTWGAASSGFLLAAVIREHLKKVEADVGEQLGKHLYADDYLQSFPCEEGAIEMVDKLRNALNSADMSLAKWKTNSEMVSRHLLSTGVDSSEFQLNSRDLFKVLGIVWSPADDYLSFHIPPVTDRLSSRTRITKRNALSIVASVYDPLGFLIPFTLRGKLLLQKLWSVNLQWDDCIPDRQRTELIEWVNELQELQHIRVRRHYSSSKQTAASYHLHVLGDASPSAYACCAYIEYRESDDRSTTSLIMCKSRLAPIDSALTLPRLELLAALIATRLKVFLVERIDVEFESVRFYTDSSITYHWITGSKPGQWKAYVHNRVAEIQKNSSPDQWYLVEGEMNIADLGTRGVPAKVLRTSSAWWNGPDWLRLPVEQQPVSRPGIDGGSLQVVQDELRFSAAPAVAVSGELLLNLDLFNSAYHAIRVMANILRFVRAARRLPSLKIAEIHRAASIRLIRTVQAQHFAGEIAAILCGDRPPRDSKIGSFRLFVDGDQVLRAKTRLTEGPHFSYEEMNPVIIPGESRFALLLIYDAHRVNAHFGVSVVLSQLRRRFWITRGRQIIKAVLGKCAVCKRRSGRPATQVEAPLPSPRVTLIAPFQTTGIDFCGPFYTRTSEGAQKVYICVFSCASTRAVHLELTPYMSTPQTHLAIRRFLAEHPACTRFISDNGRSFVRAATDVKRMINSVHNLELKNLLEGRSIDWIFNCPRSPWHGGFFERMVGTTKSALKKTLGKSLVSFEELRTIVKELAAVINDRPITYVESGIDSPAPLTPSQLIHGGPYVRTLASLTPLDQLGPNGAISGGDLRASLAERTNYFKSLSLRWYREYILQLRSAQQVRGSVSKGIAVGDVCLLKEENVSRIQWPLVRIEDCHTGRDGNPRTYTIRTANGKTTRRAAQLLIPLEVVDNPPVSTPTTEEAESTG